MLNPEMIAKHITTFATSLLTVAAREKQFLILLSPEWIIPLSFNPQDNFCSQTLVPSNGIALRPILRTDVRFRSHFYLPETFTPVLRSSPHHAAHRKRRQIAATRRFDGGSGLLPGKRVLGFYGVFPAPPRPLLRQRMPPLPLRREEKQGRIGKIKYREIDIFSFNILSLMLLFRQNIS